MKTIIPLFLTITYTVSFCQNRAEAEKLVNEGIHYHDKGDYSGAISRYDKALELDKNNLLALTEKAISLLSLNKYDESISCCQMAITTHPDDKGLMSVYVAYGNALDALNKTDQSIEIYDEGIKKFPDYYQLYFNKSVTLASVKKYDEALSSLQISASLNPRHASSHNAIARISYILENRIPAILAYSRFFVIEPQSDRAKENVQSMQKLMKENVKKTDNKSISISVNSGMLSDTTADGKIKENNFSTADLMLSMATALDYDRKYKKETEVQQFQRKFESIFSALKSPKKEYSGFFWNYYAPYFTELMDKNFIETFSHIVLASSDNKEIAKWIKEHSVEIDKFYEWSKAYEWKSNHE